MYQKWCFANPNIRSSLTDINKSYVDKYNDATNYFVRLFFMSMVLPIINSTELLQKLNGKLVATHS